MAKSEIKIEFTIYGRIPALLVVFILSKMGVSEKRCVCVALGMMFVRMRINDKYTVWKRMSSMIEYKK